MNVSTRTTASTYANYRGANNYSGIQNFFQGPARFMRWLFVLCLMASVTAGVNAQNLGNYTFSTATNASLEDLSTGATSLLTGNNDDVASDVAPIGFPFLFMGQLYTHFSANSNGQLKLNTSITDTKISSSATPTNNMAILAPFGGDNEVNNGIRYKVIGTEPNRTLVVEWTEFYVSYYDLTNAGNMQLWLHEGTGQVDYVYGEIYNSYSFGTQSRSIFISSGAAATTCGSITINTPPTNPSFSLGASPVSNTIATGANPVGSPLIANIGSSSQGSRRIFSWVPSASIAGPTSLSFSNVGLTSMTLNWAASSPQTGVLGYAAFASSDGGTTYNLVGSVTGSGTTTMNVSGLTANTTYLWQVYAYSEGVLSSTYADNVQGTNSCSITGTITVGATGTYTTLTDAIAALNAQGAAGSVVFELQSDYVSTGETFPITLGAVPCMNASNTVTIRPATGATGLSITGSNTTALFSFSGASYFIIDGRPGGSGATDLTISNTGNGPAIRYINGANYNTVQYASLTSASTSTSSGIIFFSTGGNNNNTITNCDVNGGGVAANLLYSSGSSGNANTGNIISNNNFHDQFVAGSATRGLNISSNNQTWTITGNSFYQTAARTYTSGNTHYGIYISSGDGYTITNNFVGGSQSGAGGTAMTLAGSTTTFGGIYISGSNNNNISTVTGNTISNISLTSNSTTSSSAGVFSGIYSTAVSGNINNNNVSSITIVSGANSGVSGGIIASFSGTPNSTINNNTISGINISGSSTTYGSSFNAIWTTGSPTGSVTIDGNTIGHASNANSIYFSSATTGTSGGILNGIYNTGNPTGGITITNNTIANMTTAYAPSTAKSTSVMSGIYVTSGVYAVTNNSIYNFSANANSTGSGSGAGVIGISITSTTAGTSNVSQNTIYSLANNHATSANYVTGIYWGGNAASKANRNLIYSLYTPSILGFVNGIQVGASGTIENNMIRLGIDASGASRTTATNYNGIYATAAANIYHNTVYIGGTGVNTAPATPTYAFNSTVTSGTRAVLNNIFVNARSSASAGAKHYAIRLAGTTGLTINANDYFASGAFAGVLGSNNGTDVTSLAAWQAFTTQDANSISADVCFVNPAAGTPDLHLTDCSGAGNPADGIGVLTSVVEDYDGEARSGLSPIDLGADAGNYGLMGVNVGLSALVAPGPVAGCYTNAESVTVTLNNYGADLIDFSVDPVTINVTTNTGYNSSAVINTGTLAAGASQNVTLPATIDMTTTATYTFNGSATVTGDVNPANDAMPTVSRNVIALGGTYTVGSGGDFATLTEAVTAYNNANCLNGAVIFSLTDATYGSETYPIAINQHAQASATNTLTIQPATGVTASFTGSSTSSLIKINGGDYITIDGSNSGGTSRDLTFTNTATSGAVINVASMGGAGNGAHHVTIKNLNIVGGAITSGNFGIASSATSSLTTGSADNDYLTIQNNNIEKVYIGINAIGTSTFESDNLVISQNSIGSANSSNYVISRGIVVTYSNSPLVKGNTVYNLITSSSGYLAGIEIGANVFNGSIDGNLIKDIVTTNTSGYGAYGIYFSSSTGTTGVTVSNNMISGLKAINYSSSSTSDNTFGIRLLGGTNLKIYHNTINLYGDITVGSTASFSANVLLASSSITGLDLRNNIFVNTINSSISGSKAYNVYVSSGTFANIDYNDYYGTSSTSTNYITGYLSSDRTTLANWQAATTMDAHSISIEPVFTSASDLHLVPASNALLDNKGTDVGVAADFDGDSRSATTPDVGADEFTAPVVQDVKLLNLLITSGDTGCFGNAETVNVLVWNNTPFPLDLSVYPVTVTVTATGGYTSTTILNTGVINANAGVAVDMPDAIDMSAYGTYTFDGSATVTGDINTGNDALSPSVSYVSTAVAVGSVTSAPPSYCLSGGTPTLTLSSAAGGDIQWQEADDISGPWTDVGTNSLTYTPSTPVEGTKYYQAIVGCSASSTSATSDILTLNLYTPEVTGTTDGTRCGPGTMTLEATANEGSTLKWYAAASGGTELGTGTSFATPSINETTTYYVAAVTGSTNVSANLGDGASTSVSTGSGHDNVSPYDHYYGSSRRQYLFRASELHAAGFNAGKIQSIAFNVAAVGVSYADFAISIGQTASDVLSTFQSGALAYSSASVTPTVGINTYNFSTPFDWDGTSNVYVIVCWGNSNSGGNGATVKYDATTFVSTVYRNLDGADGATVCADETVTGTLSSRPQTSFVISSSCESNRVAVNATITTPPSIDVSATQDIICAGQSTDLSVTSINDPDYTYTWTPGELSGATQTVSPAATTTYTVNAVDNTEGPNAGCTAAASVTITVNPAVTDVVAGASTLTTCVGGSVDLTATANSGESVNMEYTQNFDDADQMNTEGWMVYNYGNADTWYISTSYSQSGSALTYMYDADFDADTWAVSGGIQMVKDQPVTISFWEKTSSFTEKLAVGIATTQDAPVTNMTILQDYGAHSVTDYTQRIITFVPTQTGTYYVGFHAYSDADEFWMAVDNLSVTQLADIAPTYSWTSDVGGFTSSDQNPTGVTPSEATTYTVTVTNSYGCSASNSVSVNISDLALPTPSVTDVLCNGGSTGTITAAATGGTEPYEYSIDGTNWQASGEFTGLAAGNYTVQVRDANTTPCTVSAAEVTVNEPTALLASVGGQTDPSCFGTATGTITVVASGGTAPYTYSISGPTINATGDATGEYTGLLAGDYTVTVTDANQCTAITTEVTLTDPDAPALTVGNNGPVCSGSDATLTATSGYATYVWTGPGTINDDDQATATAVTPADGAEYTVTITDANGCTNTASTTVSVVDNAAVSVSIAVTPSEEICSGTEVTFTATPVNGGVTPSYKWFVNDVEQVGETNSTFVSSSINDQDYVYCEVTSSIACTTGSPATSNTITMTVSGLIFADVTLAADNNTVCDGTSVTLTATANGTGSEPVYDFYVNYNLVQSGSSNTYTYTPVNGDEVYVDMTSSFSCAVGSPATSNTETITVNPIPAAPVVTAGGATTFCNGGSVTLTSSYATDNLWSTNETTDEITVTASGSYTVTYTELGCTSPASDPVVVTVNENPTATVTGPASVCTGSSISLSAETSIAGSGTIESYQWTLDGTTDLGTDATQEVTAAGSYTVTITNSNGCSVTSEAFVVSENTPPVAAVSATCTTLAPDQTAELTATPATGVTYSWTLDGGEELSTDNPYTTAPNVGGTYMVTVTDANGCTGTATQEISSMTGALVGGTTYNIPEACGGFPTIASVVSYLNANGVTGTGDVTIAVAAGYSETAPSTGFVLTASGTADNQIKFVVDGAGTATINAGVGANTPNSDVIDAMFKIVGGDYITIDGFTFTDGNTTNPATMEAGVAMLKADGTNGSQYNTISNNTFNMQRVNNVAGTYTRGLGAVGVGIYNTDNTSGDDVTVTVASGSNSYNKVYGNSFNGGNGGVAVIGFDGDVSPYSLADQGNDIGGSSSATGNTVLNFGDTGTGDVLGIMTYAQYGLNISYNTINNNNGSGVNHPGYLNGIYIDEATGANSDITHNDITMTNAVTTKQLSGIFNLSGATGGIVNITDNAVTLVNNATGSCNSVGYYNANAVNTLHMDNNTISMSTTATGGSNFGFYNAGSVSAALTMDGNAITGQTYATAGSSAFYGFYVTSLASTGTGSISNNSITGVSHTGAQTGAWAFVYKSASGASETINNNNINDVTVGTTSGTVYLFYVSNSNTGGEIANNTITTKFMKNSSGSGAFYGIYNLASAAGTNNVHDNNFSNITVNNTGGSVGSSSGSSMIYWYTVSGNVLNIYNNTFNNITQNGTGMLQGVGFQTITPSVYNNTFSNWSSAGTTMAAIGSGSSVGVANYYNNIINNFSSTNASGVVYGIYAASNSSNKSFYGNKINNLTSSGVTSPQVHGIYQAGGSATNAIYKNKIHSLSATGAFTTGSGMVSGITISSGTTNNVYNNFVGNLTAPAGSSTDAVRGINLTGGTTQNISFNTVYLDASSTGTNFGSSALYTATSPTLNLRSNILVNNSTASGTGRTVAYRRSSTTLTSYGSVSNKNLFYAGTPSATNLIFSDGTNNKETLADYKTFMATRDGDSKTENPPFISTTGGDADYLHINPTVETQIESGAVSVAGISDDYDGDIRFGQTGYTGTSVVGPDMGADEFDGIAPACSGALGGTASISTSSVCFGSTASNLSVSGASTGAGISYQWMVSTTLGGPYDNVVGGTGANTSAYTTPADLAVGTYYYVLQVTCTSGEGETNNSTEIALTVNAIPTATASGTSPLCSGSDINLTGTTDIGTSFAWTGPGGFTSTSQSPVRTNVSPSASGDYIFTATANGCTSEPSTFSVVVNETPSTVTVSPATSILCQGATQELTVTGGTLSTPITLWTEGFENANDWTATKDPTSPAASLWTIRNDNYNYTSTYTDGPFRSNDQSKFYMANADDAGSGSSNVTYLTSPAFSTTGLSAADISFWHYYRGSSTEAYVEASTDGTTWTTLKSYSSTQGGPTAFANANVALTAPFLNQPTVYVRFRYVAGWTYYWLVDNVSLTTPATAPIVWSPATDLYLDAEATQPYTDENVNTVYVKSNSSLTVTATATNNGCSSTASANLVINPSPEGNMESGSVAVCQNSDEPTITFTGTMGTAPYTFTYTINGGTPQTAVTGGGANPQSVTISVPTNADGTFTYAVTNVADIYCAANISGTYEVTVNALPVVSFSGLPSTVCEGSGTYTLIPSPEGGTFSGSGVTGSVFDPAVVGVGGPYTISYTYSDGTCTNIYNQDVTVTALPEVSFSGLGASYCTTDAAVTLTGSPAGGTFSGTGISGDSFDPSVAGAGTFTITYSYTDENGCSGSSTQDVDVTVCPTYTQLNMNIFLQGYYIGGGQMQPVLLNEGESASSTETDEITVEIHDGASPSTVLASVTGMLNTDGTVSVQIPASVSGSHYIAIKHRNTIQTWSANTVMFNGSTINYNFTDAADKAYGNNMAEVEPGVYAMYTGDINQDENIDILDYPELDQDINNFEFGHFSTDLNGDGNVDILDYPVLDANIESFIFSDHP